SDRALDAVVRPYPHVAVGHLGERARVGDARSGRERLKPRIVEPRRAADRAYPQPAAAILHEREHAFVRQTVAGVVALELAVLVARQSGFGADPEHAVPCFVQRGDARARQAGRVAGIEHREAVAIEADQPAERAEPQIAVAGLQNRVDRVLWQTVGGPPGLP